MQWEDCSRKEKLSYFDSTFFSYFSFLKIEPLPRMENFPFSKGKWSMITYEDPARKRDAFTSVPMLAACIPGNYRDVVRISKVFRKLCFRGRRQQSLEKLRQTSNLHTGLGPSYPQLVFTFKFLLSFRFHIFFKFGPGNSNLKGCINEGLTSYFLREGSCKYMWRLRPSVIFMLA